ncbi:hypothetical protein PAPYR_11123 [Paratrimastix pyriformis]|uniref:Uncharacterized protein n=1 Tax=Paratrimastix pyriformis TaxID=342808 RepID=A0ABQ8U4G8_9EUKA|nr:hypothetical protein PAPYR_11123 [Paratrimastix pyriformis]
MKRLAAEIQHLNESDPQALREFFESNMAAEANILNRIVAKRKGTPGPLYPGARLLPLAPGTVEATSSAAATTTTATAS